MRSATLKPFTLIFQEAIDWLCSHRDVFSDGVGVVGVSKGADLALILATYSPKVRE